MNRCRRLERAGVWIQGHPTIWTVLAIALVLGWQTLTVTANYHGQWSGLFRIGGVVKLPPQLADHTLRNAHPNGYDGQFYRVLATDPFLRGDTARYIDSPFLRSRRILVPMLAWLASMGQVRLVDPVYVLLIAGFVGAGVFFLTKLMMHYGRHAALGLLFLLVPAVPIAVDSMTIDVSLAALTVCFAYQATTGQTRWMWWTLAAATLSRETGVLLPAAAALVALIERAPKKALLWASATIPTLLWYAYLYHVIPQYAAAEGFIPKWFLPHASAGLLQRVVDPPAHQNMAQQLLTTIRVLDLTSLWITIAFVALAAFLVWRGWCSELRTAAAFFVGLVALATDKGFWVTPYGYGRPIAPLFVLVLAGAVEMGSRRLLLVAALLLAILDLRILAEMEPQARGVLRFLFGG